MVDLIGCLESSDNCLSIENTQQIVNVIDEYLPKNIVQEHYTEDWFSGNIHIWDIYKAFLYNKENMRCLEIGSFEGRSTIYTLNNYCNGNGSRLDALDTWQGSVEHNHEQKDNLYDRFLNNTQKYIDENKLQIYRDYSSNTLMKFVQELNVGAREKYDVVYIDGSHVAKDVLLDAVLSWKLLKIGGIMLFDDYAWSNYDNPAMNPKIGINSFLDVYNDMYILLNKGHQLHIIKSKDELF